MPRCCGQLVAVALLLLAATFSVAQDAALISNADALVAQGKFDSARLLYERALAAGARFDNDLPRAHNLASAYLHSRPPDLSSAIKWFRIALSLDPANDAVRVEYARALNFSRQFAEAREQFAAVLVRDPQNLAAQVGVAKAISFAGDQTTALPMYDRILQRQPGLYDAIVGKAFALLWAGRPDEARPLLTQALRLHPEDSEVREAWRSLPPAAAAAQPSKKRIPPERGADALRTKPRASAPPAVAVPVSVPSAHPSSLPASDRDPGQRRWPALVFVAVAVFAGIIAAHALLRAGWAASRMRSSRKPASPRAPIAAPRTDVTRTTIAAPPATASGADTPPTARSHPAPTGEPVRSRLRALLVGGPESLLELEARSLPNIEVRREYRWEAARALLLTDRFDLVVLNPMSHDGWSSARMLAWIESRQRLLLSRTLAISSTGEIAAPGHPEARWLLQPFSPADWRSAVVSVLHAGIPTPNFSTPEALAAPVQP